MTTDKTHMQEKMAVLAKRAYARKYYQANKVKARLYYHVNKDKIKARSKAWREANRERYLEQQRKYDATTRKYPAGEDTHPLDQKPAKNGRTPKERYYPSARW